MAAPPSPKCSVTCNSTALLFSKWLSSPAQFLNNFGKTYGLFWLWCFRSLEADGNKQEGCLLPGTTQTPPWQPPPTPHLTSWKLLTRFPSLLKQAKTKAESKMQVAITDIQRLWTILKCLLRSRQISTGWSFEAQKTRNTLWWISHPRWNASVDKIGKTVFNFKYFCSDKTKV